MNNRIKIKSQISLFRFIVAVIILLGIVGGLYYYIFTQDVSAVTRIESLATIPFIYFIISTLYNNLMSTKQYLSDIYIYDNEIILTFKIRDKISKTISIQKNNIQKFKLDAHIKLCNRGKYSSSVDVKYKFFIDLIKGQDITINQLADLTIIESNYKFLYRIMDGAKNIPNFEINFTSNSEIIKAELDYYKRFGKKIPLIVQFKKASIFLKILYLLMIASICCSIYCCFQDIRYFIPLKLSASEQKYINYVSSSYEYFQADRYNEAIESLDKAKAIFQTDPHLYYCYAISYEHKKDYYNAIKSARQGIALLGNKEIYYKQYRYKHKSDIQLYSALADSYFKNKEWQNAIEAYTYIIQNTKYSYDKSHFKRGQAYYHLRQYDLARQDFLKHKDVILDYLEDQANSEYKAKYPTYTNAHLKNIYEWIHACEKYKAYAS